MRGCFHNLHTSRSTRSAAFQAWCWKSVQLHQSPRPKNTHAQKGFWKPPQVLFGHSPQNGWKMVKLAPNSLHAKSRNPPPPPKWPPLKFLSCWQSEASVWRSLLKAPHPLSPVPTVCECTCACKLQFSGFIRLHWCLDSRKRSTNRTGWCRNGQKAPSGVLEAHFLSPSLLCSPPSVSITHSLPPSHLPPPLFFSLPLFSSSEWLCFCSLGCQTAPVLLH